MPTAHPRPLFFPFLYDQIRISHRPRNLLRRYTRVKGNGGVNAWNTRTRVVWPNRITATVPNSRNRRRPPFSVSLWDFHAKIWPPLQSVRITNYLFQWLFHLSPSAATTPPERPQKCTVGKPQILLTTHFFSTCKLLIHTADVSIRENLGFTRNFPFASRLNSERIRRYIMSSKTSRRISFESSGL